MKAIAQMLGLLLAACAVCVAEESLKPVSFVLGPTHFNTGDAIIISQVVATSPDFKTGDTITVRGTYRLQSRKEATLALFLTHPRQTEDIVTPAQTMKVRTVEGTFTLTCELKTEGATHVTLYGANGRPFGGVYFGTEKQMREVAKWLFVDYEK